MASRRFKNLTRISSTDLDLDIPAEDLRQRISERIDELEGSGKNPAIYRRLLDIHENRVLSLWKGIDSLTRNNKLSEDKLKSLFNLLTTGIDIHKSAWNRNDTRSAKAQKQDIKEIGALASKLFTKIDCSRYGYVTDFLDYWKANDVNMRLELDDLVSLTSRPELSSIAYARQNEIIERHFLPAALLLGLKTLSISASNYNPSTRKFPKSQIGLGSQKKSELVLFVIQIHIELERLTGKPHFGVNADLSSIVFERKISIRRVEEIIERARARGEISTPKSKKSPRA